MQKSIAFFDFDGTITKADTMLELAKYSSKNIPYLIGLCIIAPWLLGMKLRLISKRKAKEKLLTHFFGNTTLEIFNDTCISFNEKILPSLIKNEAIEAIQNHLHQNTKVVIVSASAENWVAPWCRNNNLEFLCTRLKVKNNIITGEIEGENCNGYEKVSRIKEVFNLADYNFIYCYGDSNGDKMMLQLATHPFYRLFKN